MCSSGAEPRLRRHRRSSVLGSTSLAHDDGGGDAGPERGGFCSCSRFEVRAYSENAEIVLEKERKIQIILKDNRVSGRNAGGAKCRYFRYLRGPMTLVFRVVWDIFSCQEKK